MDGVVKRIKRENGFGFIRGNDGIERFFHKSALVNCGWHEVAEGQEVTFDHQKADKGPRAINVQVL